jgi:hypothetical protein
MADRLTFPEYLQDDQNSNWMHIRAFKSGETSPDTTVTLFVPGGPENGSLSWKTVNDYTDPSLTKVTANFLGVGPAVAGLNSVGQMLGGTINPKVEVLYRTTQLRQFQFNFMFAPTSLGESEAVEEIVKKLRYHAAPDLIGGNDPDASYIGLSNQASYLSSGGLMRSPSEFKIDFYHKGQENPHLPKIGRSIIERIDVDYTPQGQFSTFSNGYPVSSMLTVVFKEMRFISKQNILDGF